MSVLLPLDPYNKIKQAQQQQKKKDLVTVKRNRAYCSPWIIKSSRLSTSKSKDKSNSFTASFKTICLIGCRYDVIRRIAFEKGFVEVSEKDVWNIMWTDTPISLDKALEMRRFQDAHSIFWGASPPVQKANHFPGMTEICRKDRLARNLNRMKQSFPKDYDFFPRTWSLPADLTELLMYSKAKRNGTYICKPDTGCQGKGIFLVRNLKKLNPFIKLICQVYISRPFLIDGYKFDLRIYSLITSCEPLRIYVYNEGIARFATVKYEHPSDTNLDSVYMHLTNYSLNKFSQSYVPDGEGSKRKMSSVFNWLMDNGYDVPKLVNQIDAIIVKTMIAAQPTLRHFYRASFPKYERGSACFELLGFDIIVDRSLHPFLLEVNHSPSFNLDLPVDEEIKEALLRDTFAAIFLDLGKGTPEDNSAHGRGHHDSLASGNRLSLALQNQFSHEATHKGNFRLVYPAEDHTKYQRFLDQTMGPSWLMETTSTINGNRIIPPYQQSFHTAEPQSSVLSHSGQEEIVTIRSKFGPPPNSSPAVNQHKGKGVGNYKFKFTENEPEKEKEHVLHPTKSVRIVHGQSQSEVTQGQVSNVPKKSDKLEEKKDIISSILANAKENNNNHGFHILASNSEKSKVKNPFKHHEEESTEGEKKLKKGKSNKEVDVVGDPSKPTVGSSIRKNIAEKLSQIRSQYPVNEWYVSSRLDLNNDKSENERGDPSKESLANIAKKAASREKVEKPEKSEKAEKVEKSEKSEKLVKSEKSEKSDKKRNKGVVRAKSLKVIKSKNVSEGPKEIAAEEESPPVVNETEEDAYAPIRIQEREELERRKLLLSREKFLRNMGIEEEVYKILQRTKKANIKKEVVEMKEGLNLKEDPNETKDP